MHGIDGVPVDPYRASLYSPGELYDTSPYEATLDARAYAWSRGGTAPDDTLARALHDHSIDAALTGWVSGRDVVGVMGGHAHERGSRAYADAARLGHGLGSRLTVATGGGPGAMEAANLGAFVPNDLEARWPQLARVPSFRPDVGAWARAAFEVVASTEAGRESLGHPDVALRTRAAQPVRDGDRQVLPQRAPRGAAAGGLQRRHRLPARRRRHGAGGLPGRVRELLRRRVGRRADGAGRPAALDRGAAGLAAAAVPGPRPRHGGLTCTWSTASTRRSRWWESAGPAAADRRRAHVAVVAHEQLVDRLPGPAADAAAARPAPSAADAPAG